MKKKMLFRAKDHPNMVNRDDEKPQYVSAYLSKNVCMKTRKKRGVRR